MAQLDPSIFMTTRQKSPLDYLQEMAAQDQLANQSKLQRLQLLGQQRAFDDAEQARQVRNRGMAAVQALGGGASIDQRIKAAEDVGDYGTADSMRKMYQSQRESDAKVAKETAETGKAQTANMADRLKLYRASLDYIDTPEGAARWLAAQYQDPATADHMASMVPLEQAVQRIPKDPQQFAMWRQQNAMGMEKFMDQQRQAEAQRESARHNKAQEGLTARGQNLSDARARESLAENRRQFEVAQANGGKGNVTEGERNASGYALRMQEATKLLDQYESTGKPTYTTKAVGAIPLVGGVAQRNVMSPDQQSYRQAQEDWVRAKLRKESGAVIGKDEMEAEIATYFPQPGDTDQVIAQKRASRDVANQAMNNSAGRAAPKSSPKAEAQRKVVRTGKDASGRKVVQYDDGTIDYAP